MLATSELIQEAALPQRLGELLPRWQDRVPLYQRGAGAPQADGPPSAFARLRHLPLITKQDIRRNFPANFLGADADIEGLLERDLVELEHTSGTSEARTPLVLPRGWWAEQETRALRLNRQVAQVLDAYPDARRVTISSPVCSGDICYTGTPSCDDRTLGNARFVSLSRYPFLWSEADLDRIAEETLEWAPQFLDVDPVYGVAFARHCERRGLRLPSLEFVIASYEFISVAHRRILQRVFGVPVFNLYGSTETGHLLMEDETGQMRPSLETACLEIVDPDAGGVGDLVVTTLTNDFMPLVRYRIGDLVQASPQPYGTHYVVHGRAADAFTTPGGQRVTIWQVDQALADLPGFAHYQLSQRNDGAWLFRYLPDISPPTPAQTRELRRRLITLLALSDLELAAVDALMPESSGKFRLGYPARRFV